MISSPPCADGIVWKRSLQVLENNVEVDITAQIGRLTVTFARLTQPSGTIAPAHR
ncbi:hypothetical protein D3C87_2075880 [compost metagenome]